MEIKKEEEEEKKRPPNLSKTLNNWQKELCLLDLCPTQQWAFLRVLWHHLRQLRFSEFLIVTLGEESSVQLRLLWDKEKNLLGVICQVFFFVVVFKCHKRGGGPRILGLSLMTLSQRQIWMNTFNWISQSIRICPQWNKNHQSWLSFHFFRVSGNPPWISSFPSTEIHWTCLLWPASGIPWPARQTLSQCLWERRQSISEKINKYTITNW